MWKKNNDRSQLLFATATTLYINTIQLIELSWWNIFWSVQSAATFHQQQNLSLKRLKEKLCTVSTTALEAYAAIKKRKGGKSLKSLHRSFNALYLTIQQRGCGGCFLYKRKACSVCFADFTRQRANMTRVPLMEWNPLFVSKPRLLRNCSGQKHQHSIAAKMLRRTSIFQEKLNERNLHQQKILHSAFMSLNWHSLMQLSIDVEVRHRTRETRTFLAQVSLVGERNLHNYG